MSSDSDFEYEEDVEYDQLAMQSEHFDESDQNDIDQSPIQYTEQQTKKLLIQQDENDKTCATYVFLDEDHTLGNALRYVLCHQPLVEFCGYSLPHPSENKMNLRLQTLKSTTTDKVLNEGLNTLAKMCEVLNNKFQASLKQFDTEQRKKLMQ